MNRTLISLVFGILILTSPASAGIMISSSDSTFTPGTAFAFSVELPSLTNLGAYNIDILLTGDTGTAGTDFFFDLAQTVPASSGYVFTTDVFFASATNNDSTLTQRLTLTDFDFFGLNVIPGVNSNIAEVVVQTSGGYTGNLTLSVDTTSLLLDTPDLIPTPVAEFSTVVTETAAATPATFTSSSVVPEPSTFAIFSIAIATLGCRRRRGG
ncbi:MAG: PEP-CTERM sorting domain-containing protein [Planctomycetota bacterium]